MAEVEYMHVCDYAFSAQGGKPCIIGIFDRITTPVFPVAHPFMSIAIKLCGTAHEIVPIKIELGRPNGDVLVGMEGKVVANENGGASINFNLVNIKFPEAGRYTVKVSSAGRTLVLHSLHVQKGQPPSQAGPQAKPSGPVH